MANEAAAVAALDKGLKSGSISGGAFMKAFSRVTKGENIAEVFKDTYKHNQNSLTKYLSYTEWEAGFPLLQAELNELATAKFGPHGYDVQFTGVPKVNGHVANECAMVFKCEVMTAGGETLESFEWDVGEAPWIMRLCADQNVPEFIFAGFCFDNTVVLRKYVPAVIPEDIPDAENRSESEFWKVTDESALRAVAGYGPVPTPAA